MKFPTVRCACALVFCLASTPVLLPLNAAPTSIVYQGSLKQSGTLVNGTIPIIFNITNADGSQVYWTSGAQSVTVKEGLYRVELAPTGVDWENVDPYIETRVNGTLLLPREKMSNAPYALAAKDLTAGATAKGNLQVNGNLAVGTPASTTIKLVLIAASQAAGIVNTIFGAGYSAGTIDGNRQFWIQQWVNSLTARTFLVGNGYVSGTASPAANDGPFSKFSAIEFNDTSVGFVRNVSGTITPTLTSNSTSGNIGVPGSIFVGGEVVGSAVYGSQRFTAQGTTFNIPTVGTNQDIQTANGKDYAFTVNGSAKTFSIWLANGDGCLVTTNYITSTITIVGTGGLIFASSSGGDHSLAISKSANSHVIHFKTGTNASAYFGTWGVCFYGSSVGAIQ